MLSFPVQTAGADALSSNLTLDMTSLPLHRSPHTVALCSGGKGKGGVDERLNVHTGRIQPTGKLNGREQMGGMVGDDFLRTKSRI